MLQPNTIPIREECPPGTCVCEREKLLDNPTADIRVLRLTKWEEKKLITHIESMSSFADLKRLEERLYDQLGIVLQITPSIHEVRTVRGINIQLADQLGLCKKIRQTIPAAIRKCLEKHPEIAYAILDAHDLFGDRQE
jgi:hypothetical protein